MKRWEEIVQGLCGSEMREIALSGWREEERKERRKEGKNRGQKEEVNAKLN